MASIHPLIFVCFAACVGLVLSLWQRRNIPGFATLVALTAAIWGGVWVRVLQADTAASVGLSYALFQFVPALFYLSVGDNFTAPESQGSALRRAITLVSCAFAGLAGTSAFHTAFVSLSAGDITYMLGSYAALGFGLIVAGLGIYQALAKHNKDANLALRAVLFVALPVVLLCLSIAGFVYGLELSGLNPVVFASATALAAGAWLLARYESRQDEDVRNLVFNQLPNPVVVLDGQQHIVDCNDAFAELVDYPLEELHGSALKGIVSETNFQALTEPEGQEYEVRWEHAEDVLEHYSVSALVLEGKSGARVLHMTESDSHRHAQQALETADLQLEQAHASLDRLTFNDELTGLANQRRFIDELENEIARHQRSGMRFGIIAIEADHFNVLDEQHGAAFRDRSLALIARAIEVEVRDTDLCARLEGEEFAVLAVQMKVPGLVNLAERIRKRVLKVRPHAPGGERVRMSVSCGVGVFNPKQDDLRSLLARTDRYLAEAKRSGRNQVVSDD